MSSLTEQTQAKKNVTILGAVINVVLSVLKIGIGWIGQSHALMADGFHSLSDLLSDGLVYYAAHHANQKADDKHPYGHARYETLATAILGILLIAVAGAIIWDAGMRIVDDKTISYGWLIIAAASISILSKEVLYHLTLRVAKKTKSNLLRANAWHHRSDAISSLIVLFGVGMEMAGFKYFDSIAAALVGLMVAKIGFELMLGAANELVDSGLNADKVGQIKSVILSVAGVRELHFLRTRKMGAVALVDVHILVEPKISVSEGHLISETVRLALVDSIEDLGEVMVHIDPEDDELSSPSICLPLRDELLAQLTVVWAGIDEASDVKQVNLHYLDGKVFVEIELPLSLLEKAADPKGISTRFQQATVKLPAVEELKVVFS